MKAGNVAEPSPCRNHSQTDDRQLPFSWKMKTDFQSLFHVSLIKSLGQPVSCCELSLVHEKIQSSEFTGGSDENSLHTSLPLWLAQFPSWPFSHGSLAALLLVLPGRHMLALPSQLPHSCQNFHEQDCQYNVLMWSQNVAESDVLKMWLRVSTMASRGENPSVTEGHTFSEPWTAQRSTLVSLCLLFSIVLLPLSLPSSRIQTLASIFKRT